MKVRATKEHLGEGHYPTFKKGTSVTIIEECAHFLNWYACEISGHKTYVPELFVRDGKLTRDYNPTELALKAGDTLEVKEIVYAWLIAANEEGETGWIPAETVVSVS